MKPRGPLRPLAPVGAMREEDELRVGVGDQLREAWDLPEEAVPRVLDAPRDVLVVEDVDGDDHHLVERVRGEDAGELRGLVGREIRQAKWMKIGAKRTWASAASRKRKFACTRARAARRREVDVKKSRMMK